MGGNVAKDRKKDRITEDCFVYVDKFDVSVDEGGEREVERAYFYQNGDRYVGDWKNGRRHGYGNYTYANGKRVKGWFYKGFFLGSQPNEKLKKERRKKCKAISGSEPLPPFRSLLHSVPESDLGRKTRISTSREDFPRTKTYKLPGKEEEKKERQRSLKLREAIRAKYFLPGPSRKNPSVSHKQRFDQRPANQH